MTPTERTIVAGLRRVSRAFAPVFAAIEQAATAMARAAPPLDCGHADDGRPIYGCMRCGHTRCDHCLLTTHACQERR